MKKTTSVFLSTVIFIAFSFGAPASHAEASIGGACAKVGEGKFVIKEYDSKLVSVCRADDVGDCLYTKTFGKTFADSRPDLNADGLKDYVIKDLSGPYGDNDVTHFMLFAQCHDGAFVKIGDDFFTSIKPDVIDPATGWLKLRVARDCYDEGIGDTQERTFTIVFDSKKLKYGPPNSDRALTRYCSNKELALPPDSARAAE
ncbi:hypothetical protein PQQ59_24980 [Paraburkholderia aspalathi]|uniref:hypothetical protein n=1 Tax=Paraburkholderia aspalathi TaxID=1324617 RepID=UPI0038BE1B60